MKATATGAKLFFHSSSRCKGVNHSITDTVYTYTQTPSQHDSSRIKNNKKEKEKSREPDRMK